MSENQINRVKLQEMMNLIEAQRIETEEMMGEDEEESTVCVNIVMTVKPEWIHEVKFRESSLRRGLGFSFDQGTDDENVPVIPLGIVIKSGKKWAEAHERGLLTFRATVG
jgi:hypothetical protein